jgi:hypothetical protein
MAQTRFTCTLTMADEPDCQSYARVTIADSRPGAADRQRSPKSKAWTRHYGS